MTKFDYFKFREEINGGDINALNYMEETLIAELKEKNKKSLFYTREDYIISLFYAVQSLNQCNDIYETSNVKNKFNSDLYFQVRDLLLEELGLLSLFD